MSTMTHRAAAFVVAAAMVLPTGVLAQGAQTVPSAVPVLSMSPAPTALAQNRAGGVRIVRMRDAASPGLQQALRTGAKLGSLVLALAGGPNQKMLHITMYSVKVTSYSVNGSGLDDGAIPTETLSLNFDKITWKYFP